MLTKAQKKKREKIRKKLILIGRIAGVVLFLTAGLVYLCGNTGGSKGNVYDTANKTDQEFIGTEATKNTGDFDNIETSGNGEAVGDNSVSGNNTVSGNSTVEKVEASDKSAALKKKEVFEKEEAEDIRDASQNITDSRGRININTAGVKELCSLNGIGEKRAKDIISYREEHGGFECIEDIMKVKGIKQGVFGKIKDHIFCG